MKVRVFNLLVFDLLASFLSFLLSALLRYDFIIPHFLYPILEVWVPTFLIIQTLVFLSSDIYNSIWRFTSFFDLFTLSKAVSISYLLLSLSVIYLMPFDVYPKSVLVLFFILNSLAIFFNRILVRIYFSHFKSNLFFEKTGDPKRIILIGAGDSGEKIARDLIVSKDYKLIGFVDDDSKKIGKRVHGFKVFGNVDNIINLKNHYDEILICAPTASTKQIKNIIKICRLTGKPYKTVPSLNELLNKRVSLKSVRDVSYLDILGRDEISLDSKLIKKMIKGKRVLISGAGGSIGSELLSQCVNYSPSEIICIDYNEEKIFGISSYGKMNRDSNKITVKPILVDINNKLELQRVFNDHRPHIVLHAAAYKHVPIQELQPWTAVRTNIGGTLNMIELSDQFNVDKFVLVSTDKAVNPVNVMGATKRVSEKLIKAKNQFSKTQFMAVRFGNVLGSSGSAIPLFQDQINKGGPITVTHPEMTRYFMSIQEASQLILQSASIGSGGEIFLLEMGEPIKIDQLAKDMIKLSGLELDRDISIVYIGLRAGEKLYEELQYTGEMKIKTEHEKIRILKQRTNIEDWIELKNKIEFLLEVSKSLDIDTIQLKLSELISTYNPRSFHNSNEKYKNNLSSFDIKVEA